MSFYTRKKVPPVVPIVSLIDILAILLIFFIATTTFRKKETLVNITLPSSAKLSQAAAPTKRAVLEVSENDEIALDGQILSIAQLAGSLAAKRSANPEMKFEFKLDENVRFGMLVEVYDACLAAGLSPSEIPVRILLDR